MPNDLERPSLRVEGRDDLYSIANLLVRHGVDYDTKPWPADFPKFVASGGVAEILDGMKLAVETAGRKPVGFVLDADSPLKDRWEAVCGKLRSVGLNPPGSPPAEGFVEYTQVYKTTVGVWLMPNNQQDGKLETFLRTLVEEKDGIINDAADSTKRAKELGAAFSDPDTIKAVLHVWLAWQKEPGYPFGKAIAAEFFTHDSPAAVGFVAWFKKLYGIDAAPIASNSPT